MKSNCNCHNLFWKILGYNVVKLNIRILYGPVNALLALGSTELHMYVH